MCSPSPPSSHKTDPGSSPSRGLIGRKEDDKDEDLEVEFEEYPLEYNPELGFDIDPDSDPDIVPPYSSS